MNQFQRVWSFVQRSGGDAKGPDSDRPEEDTTVKAARKISTAVLRHELTESEKRWAGPLVHYAFGTAVGGLYGAVAEKSPQVTAGDGLPFGAVFWLVADETAVPLFELSEPPGRYPVSVHLYALASHLVFGAVAELVRREVRERL
jgi:putative membrane protein